MLQISQEQSLILNQALTTFGLKSQMIKTIEELTELSLKLQHGNERGFDNSDIQEECADVFVCLWYIIQNFGIDEIQKNVDFKIDRLRLKLNLLDKSNSASLTNKNFYEISDLPEMFISIRAYNSIRNYFNKRAQQISFLELSKISKKQLLKVKATGINTVNEINLFLKKLGISMEQ